MQTTPLNHSALLARAARVSEIFAFGVDIARHTLLSYVLALPQCTRQHISAGKAYARHLSIGAANKQ